MAVAWELIQTAKVKPK